LNKNKNYGNKDMKKNKDAHSTMCADLGVRADGGLVRDERDCILPSTFYTAECFTVCHNILSKNLTMFTNHKGSISRKTEKQLQELGYSDTMGYSQGEIPEALR
jgi:hypothetical protein